MPSETIRTLYDRIEDLETERWQRGILDLSGPPPSALGVKPSSVLHDADPLTGDVTLHFADDHGCKMSVRLTPAQAREVGLQDPEGYWRQKYREAVINGVSQKARDGVYREMTGSREDAFWTALERALTGSDPVLRAVSGGEAR